MIFQPPYCKFEKQNILQFVCFRSVGFLLIVGSEPFFQSRWHGVCVVVGDAGIDLCAPLFSLIQAAFIHECAAFHIRKIAHQFWSNHMPRRLSINILSLQCVASVCPSHSSSYAPSSFFVILYMRCANFCMTRGAGVFHQSCGRGS